MKLNLCVLTLTLTLALAASTSAFAENRVAEIAAGNPGASPYQILEKLYSETQIPALITDIDLASAPGNQKCAFAKATDPTPRDLFVGRYEITTEGEPDHGPLFPGTPATVKSILIVTSSGSQTANTLARSAGASTLVFSTPTELVISATQVYADAPVAVKLRRNGNLIALNITTRTGSADEARFYGYCYR